jgi:hypothetical protein
MQTKKFKRDFLVDTLGLPYDEDKKLVEILVQDICDQSRWSTHYRLIFKLDGECYETFYSEGSTEMQEEDPWEYEDEVECTIVEPVEVKIIQYLPKE